MLGGYKRCQYSTDGVAMLGVLGALGECPLASVSATALTALSYDTSVYDSGALFYFVLLLCRTAVLIVLYDTSSALFAYRVAFSVAQQ